MRDDAPRADDARSPMTAVYIVLSRCRSRRPMLASKICDIQRTDYSIDSSMRARAIQMVPEDGDFATAPQSS
ncbi:hypothetical protein EAS61_34990 [Bradyrhizobium zhanjiangense]|uniref:Uncharacterized protein n=1 Tax=Bradyrhizobium zhanjiangense TaxID=1325107 RepID=A0A4Q0Q8M2_9BRAD|nr:hypothetical protein EAS61_34990 [Bradyrhizobium zhanjiangense]